MAAVRIKYIALVAVALGIEPQTFFGPRLMPVTYSCIWCVSLYPPAHLGVIRTLLSIPLGPRGRFDCWVQLLRPANKA